jgi:hypothetical protein
VAAESFGAKPGRLLGIDVRSIELASELAPAEHSPATLRQPIVGDLDPATAWRREGFYKGSRWTLGDASLLDLGWQVAEGDTHLVVRLQKLPVGEGPSGGLRVGVNGIELAFSRREGRQMWFSLYRNLREINTIRLVSPTFVATQADDAGQRLGVQLGSLSIR